MLLELLAEVLLLEPVVEVLLPAVEVVLVVVDRRLEPILLLEVVSCGPSGWSNLVDPLNLTSRWLLYGVVLIFLVILKTAGLHQIIVEGLIGRGRPRGIALQVRRAVGDENAQRLEVNPELVPLVGVRNAALAEAPFGGDALPLLLGEILLVPRAFVGCVVRDHVLEQELAHFVLVPAEVPVVHDNVDL